MEVKYSFIVPVYNVEKYISKCIDSLLAQTYRLFEIIIVDDGSPDASGNIADSYQSKYPGIVKVIHQKNTGQGGARNHGIELAQGEYILFVDGDDFVVPNMLEIVDTYTGKYNNDLLFFQWETIEEKSLSNALMQLILEITVPCLLWSMYISSHRLVEKFIRHPSLGINSLDFLRGFFMKIYR